MRRFIIALMVTMIAVPALAQETNYAWCGYALIENLVIEERQLEQLARLFPSVEEAGMSEAMDYIQSDDGYTTIIDGCWLFPPDRQIVVSLIEQADGLSYEDADLNLVYYEFTGETSGESAAAARQYIIENARRFNGDPMDDYES